MQPFQAKKSVTCANFSAYNTTWIDFFSVAQAKKMSVQLL
jgi:hypothetical protein